MWLNAITLLSYLDLCVDCIEKYTLKYLCTVSNLLPPENRGDPADVDPEILHKAIMEVNTSMLPNRTSKLLEEVSKVKIHYRNQIMAYLTQRLVINHHIVTAYCPWTNEAAKRMCQKGIRALCNLCSEQQLHYN